MNDMHNTLLLLERIIAARNKLGSKNKISNRSIVCLKSPEAEYTQGWHCCLPQCFNEALDIKRTVLKGNLTWTQGALFSFKKGDVIHSHKDGYQKPLCDLGNDYFCIQITSASDATPASKESASSPGIVNCVIFRPNRNKSGIEFSDSKTITQDQFVRFLIAGELMDGSETQMELFSLSNVAG